MRCLWGAGVQGGNKDEVGQVAAIDQIPSTRGQGNRGSISKLPGGLVRVLQGSRTKRSHLEINL